MTINASRRESLILDHLPQVEHLTRSLHRRCPHVELDDLIQAGTIRPWTATTNRAGAF